MPCFSAFTWCCSNGGLSVFTGEEYRQKCTYKKDTYDERKLTDQDCIAAQQEVALLTACETFIAKSKPCEVDSILEYQNDTIGYHPPQAVSE